jgi:hypothetical protein
MRVIEKMIIEAIRNNETAALSKRDRVESNDTETRVYLHYTQIATLYHDRIIVNSGGWRTNTTKSRLNTILSAFTDFGIAQRDFAWHVVNVKTRADDTVDFFGGMSLKRTK